MYFLTVCVVFSHARTAFPKISEVKHTIYFEWPYFKNLVEILCFSYYLCFGVILDPELSCELLSTYLESHNRNDIFLNNHRVGEDYDKY